jgi:hypothetical protein
MSQAQNGRANTKELVKRRRKKASRACSHCQKVVINKESFLTKHLV